MTPNPEPIGPPRQHAFQHLLAYVTGPDTRSQTADTGEWTLCQRLLALGAALWRRFFVTRAAVRPTEPVTAPDGTRLTAHDWRPTTDASVVGNVRVARHSCTAPGQEGRCPRDAALSWPARGSAERLREGAAYGATDASSRASPTVLARLRGLPRSVPAIATGVTEAGEEVTPVDEPPAAPPAPGPMGTILVVQADGTGVPRVQPPPQTPPRRVGKGQKRGQQQEAIVTGLDTSAPYPRTPQAVVAALLQESGRPEPGQPARGPRAKSCGRPWRGRPWP